MVISGLSKLYHLRTDTTVLSVSQKAFCFPLILGKMPSNLTVFKFDFYFFHVEFG